MDDNVDPELTERFERYMSALFDMSLTDNDAAQLWVASGVVPAAMRQAFINAAINNVPEVLLEMAPSYHGIDIIGLAERLRFEVIVRRLE